MTKKECDKIGFKKLVFDDRTWRPKLSEWIWCEVTKIENGEITYEIIGDKEETCFSKCREEDMVEKIFIGN